MRFVKFEQILSPFNCSNRGQKIQMEFKKLKSDKKIPETRPSKEEAAQNAAFKGTPQQFQLINPLVHLLWSRDI